MKQNTKTVLMNTANSFAALTSASITSMTGTVDTFGFRYASISGFADSTSGLHTTAANNLLAESDDNSTFSTITAAVAGAAFTPTSAALSTSLAKVTYNVDLRGRKRYLKCTLALGTASPAAQLVCILSQPVDGVVTAAEQGAGFISVT